MPSEQTPVRDARERTIAALSELFAHDHLDVDEFERRLTLAHRATSVDELGALLAGLEERTPTAALARTGETALATTGVALVPAASVEPARRIRAILGGATRTGPWSCPRRLRISAILGGVELDFREARLAAGVTTVEVTAVMGGLHVLVPPGLAVEMDGTAIMGGFDHMERAPVEPDPERPVLRISGFAVMGGVFVETRLPGESERRSHRRSRHERRALRRAERSARRALPPHDE